MRNVCLGIELMTRLERDEEDSEEDDEEEEEVMVVVEVK